MFANSMPVASNQDHFYRTPVSGALSSLTLLACVICFLLPAEVLGQNLLKNGNFNNVNPRGHETIFVRQDFRSGGDHAGAEHWTTATSLNPGATVETEWMSSSFPVANNKQLWVRTTNGGIGIVQVFAPLHGGPTEATACVWVYIERGEVCVGLGDGGNTHCSIWLKETDQWELITVGNGVSPANQIVIAGAGGSSTFYVASAAVFRGPPYEQEELCCSPRRLLESTEEAN